MINKILIFNNFVYAGGTLVMSELCKVLRELGYDARLYMHPYAPSHSTSKNDRLRYLRDIAYANIRFHLKRWICGLFPNSHFFDRYRVSEDGSYMVEGVKYQYLPFFSRKNTIVIYPEVIFGNPLFAKNVCRWLLYHYKYEGDPKAYDKEDLFIAYRDVFNSVELNPECTIAQINSFNHKLYHQYNLKERKGNCYIIYKGRDRLDLPKQFDGPTYDNNMTQQELVEMFNKYKYCYSYDLQTFYTTIAAVCGCIPIEVPLPNKSMAELRTSEEQQHYGIAWGDSPEQIQYAIDTRSKLLESLDYSKQNQENAMKLIRIFESKWGTIKRQNYFDFNPQ